MSKLVSYFIPEKYIEDKELNRKSRFVIWFTYFVLVVSVPIFIYTYSERPDDIGNIVVGSVLMPVLIFSLWIFKRTGSFMTVTHIVCGFFTLGISGAPVTSGGVYSPDMPTIYVIPVFALIMGNAATGIFYAVLMMSIFFGYYIAEINNPISFRGDTNQLAPEYYMMNLVFNALMIIFMVFRNENLRLKAVGELKETNEMVSEKNKEITDSINYARRIQSAILPQKEYVKLNLPDSFFLYQPKDIVSGDFYWMTEKNGTIFLAVADCTGHGVPGAFMSVVGMNLLNEIVNHRNIFHPSEILKELNVGVVSALQQNQTETNDGMDIALLKISSDKKYLEYAGANRPLFQMQNNQLSETKPTKSPIGGFNSGKEKNFETITITLEKGDMIFLSTDGYADQFGSDKNKKITTKKFKMLLESVSSKSLAEQETYLRDFINKWKEGYEQTDDILVVGLRF